MYRGTFDDDAAFGRLAETLEKLDAERGTGGNHAFYLSIPPKAFPVVCEQLQKSGLARQQEGKWSRVVIEKPFGHDLAKRPRRSTRWSTACSPRRRCSASTTTWARRPSRTSWRCASPTSCSSRCGTPTTSTTSRSRWPRTSGWAVARGYYDGIGAARDVIQNHLLQLLALTAMEEPINFNPTELQDEKIKVLSAVQLAEPLSETTSRGQYTAGWQGGEKVIGLLDEEGFSKESTTETFAAITLEVDSPAVGWRAVLPENRKTIGPQGDRNRAAVQAGAPPAVRPTMTEELGKNALVIRIQPDEGVTMRFGSKVPGTAMEVRDVNMDFSYGVGVRRGLTRGLRAADPRRAARGAVPVPGQRKRSNWPGRYSIPCSTTGRHMGGPIRMRPARGVLRRRSRCCGARPGWRRP